MESFRSCKQRNQLAKFDCFQEPDWECPWYKCATWRTKRMLKRQVSLVGDTAALDAFSLVFLSFSDQAGEPSNYSCSCCWRIPSIMSAFDSLFALQVAHLWHGLSQSGSYKQSSFINWFLRIQELSISIIGSTEGGFHCGWMISYLCRSMLVQE